MATINLLNPRLTVFLTPGTLPSVETIPGLGTQFVAPAPLSILHSEIGGSSVTTLHRITDRNYEACTDLIRRYSAFKCGDAEAGAFFGRRLAWKIISAYGREIVADRSSWAVIPTPRLSILRAANHLSRSVADTLGLEYLDLHLVSSSQDTGNYSKLSAEQRLSGRRRFDLRIDNIESLAGRRLLLIDDCVTTGATMKLTGESLKSQFAPAFIAPFSLLRLATESPTREHDVNTAWLKICGPKDLAALLNQTDSVATKYIVEHIFGLEEPEFAALTRLLKPAGLAKLRDAADRHRSDGHTLPRYPLLHSGRRVL